MIVNALLVGDVEVGPEGRLLHFTKLLSQQMVPSKETALSLRLGLDFRGVYLIPEYISEGEILACVEVLPSIQTVDYLIQGRRSYPDFRGGAIRIGFGFFDLNHMLAGVLFRNEAGDLLVEFALFHLVDEDGSELSQARMEPLQPEI